MSTNEKSREDRVRRILAKRGLRLEKTPARSWLRHHYPIGYMIVRDNCVVEGCGSRPYQATLADIEAFMVR